MNLPIFAGCGCLDGKLSPKMVQICTRTQRIRYDMYVIIILRHEACMRSTHVTVEMNKLIIKQCRWHLSLRDKHISSIIFPSHRFALQKGSHKQINYITWCTYISQIPRASSSLPSSLSSGMELGCCRRIRFWLSEWNDINIGLVRFPWIHVRFGVCTRSKSE